MLTTLSRWIFMLDSVSTAWPNCVITEEDHGSALR